MEGLVSVWNFTVTIPTAIGEVRLRTITKKKDKTTMAEDQEFI